MTSEDINSILSGIKHPETGEDIVSLGMVQNIKTEEGKLSLSIVFKTNDAFVSSIKAAALNALQSRYPAIKVRILELRKETPVPKPKPEIASWGLDKVKHMIAIASGKGGVGKSTTSSNLAVALAQMGYSVGLVDADLYGPSIPKMFGVEGAQPMMVEVDGHELIEPIEQYGVRLLSIGFFVGPDDPIIWRGPVATSALRQLTKQGAWGELDFLLVDLPPGTGDIHITMIQEIKLSGAIIVTTPQEVALADVLKGVNMFRNQKISIPILGLIENMAWFTPAELPENKYYIFGKDGGKRMAEKLDIPLLGQIPLVQSICESGDAGTPVVMQNNVVSKAFQQVAENFIKELNSLPIGK